MSSLDTFRGLDGIPLTSVTGPRPGRDAKPTPKAGPPDRVVGRLKADRKDIVNRMLTAGVVCLDCAPERSELVEPDRVRVYSSDLPAVGQHVAQVRVVRCDVCGRVWDVMRREWAPEPEPIEERK